jgi:hypothetical protein
MGGLSSRVEQAVRPVLDDLERTLECDIIVVPGDPDDPWGDDQEVAYVTRRSDPSASGFAIQPGEPLAWSISRAADAIQEHVIENICNTWPTCPAHPNHPLWAVDRNAVWRCRSDPSIEYPIGQLPRA